MKLGRASSVIFGSRQYGEIEEVAVALAEAREGEGEAVVVGGMREIKD